MASPLKLKLQQKITVSQPGSKELYTSVIEDVEENREISIAIPLSHSSSLPVKVGELLTVRLSNEAHCVEFTTTVIGFKIENVPLYVLRYPEDVTRVQLRENVRMDLLMDLLYKRISSDEEEDEELEYKKGTLLNISAGGMKITVPEQFTSGEQVALKFELPVRETVHSLHLKARVIRAVPLESKKKNQPVLYQLGLFFLNITNSQRDNITQYIFSKMAAMRRDGKA